MDRASSNIFILTAFRSKIILPAVHTQRVVWLHVYAITSQSESMEERKRDALVMFILSDCQCCCKQLLDSSY